MKTWELCNLLILDRPSSWVSYTSLLNLYQNTSDFIRRLNFICWSFQNVCHSEILSAKNYHKVHQICWSFILPIINSSVTQRCNKFLILFLSWISKNGGSICPLIVKDSSPPPYALCFLPTDHRLGRFFLRLLSVCSFLLSSQQSLGHVEALKWMHLTPKLVLLFSLHRSPTWCLSLRFVALLLDSKPRRKGSFRRTCFRAAPFLYRRQELAIGENFGKKGT
ncbi:hypothetical protein CPB84DRAFT_1788856 [Gymnopilus junonius]|uniref:Uncharacterized protein n=1 Tax=Gymnopilus junonius TaxID=109634 RepID=A0A9P5NGC1_GYMJU|nr:hypothetical protein CPB84DRAFT_1788856 [Gymnopilus junonius]